MVAIVANFPHSANSVAMWVAADRGFFQARGLEVAFEQARGSASQYQGLMAGRIQIFTTLMENVIAYQRGEGETQFDPAPDAFAFMGASLGHQNLMARPGIERIADLKGHILAASGLRTGNAIVLYGILARAGLERGRDYRVVAVGGGPVTLESLTKAGATAALMGAPYDREALAAGFNMLGDTSTTFGGYQSSVYAARRSWAASHRTELVSLIAALIEAHRYVFDDAAGAIAVLRAHLPALSPDAASAIHRDLVALRGGLNREGRIAPRDVGVVLDLRREFAENPQPRAKLSDFYDPSYYDEAMSALAR